MPGEAHRPADRQAVMDVLVRALRRHRPRRADPAEDYLAQLGAEYLYEALAGAGYTVVEGRPHVAGGEHRMAA